MRGPTRAHCTPQACPPPPSAKDGRSSLFGTLNGSEAGGLDAWVGNPCIQPDKGRRALGPPPDPKGRRGLAEVLSLASPGAGQQWGGGL